MRVRTVPADAHNPVAFPYFATAAKGTEGLLREELRTLNVKPIRGDRGGVHFGGELVDAFRVCLQSRIAMRVLELRGQAAVTNSDQLYDFVSSLRLDDVLEPRLTLAVTATVNSSFLTHSQYVSRRVKDAIVDRQRQIQHARSNVDATNPDVHIVVHVVKNRVSLYVDLAGEPLHRRGYRTSPVEAPLKESLAAALVQLSRWDRESPLVDPCCGSGTIALEAAMLACNIAPGLARIRFGLERHARIDPPMQRAFEDCRHATRNVINRERAELVQGSDIDIDAISLAKQAAHWLNLSLQFARKDILNLPVPAQAVTVVTNPPYGVRLDGGEDLARRIGSSLRKFVGSKILVLSPDPVWLSAMGQKPQLEHTLFNGNIECRALGWQL